MTGGGATKYAKLFNELLGVSIQRTDEMDSIMAGLALLASHTNSVFRFDVNTRQRVPVDVSRDLYPFLVVNIGSGVSILKAKSASSFVRVTGTCIGGGTVLGLARLLFHAKSFRQVVRLSERGTHALDLRVADLCGDAAGSRCIAPDALASSFGRLYLEDSSHCPRPRKEDIARSLLHMVSYNLGYLAYLIGTAHGVRRIFFAGKFINNYEFTMESITQGVNFYMQQYDQHTPQSCLRGPASPLLAAPPTFNVNAQQQALQQQQLFLQQQQQHVTLLRTTTAAGRVCAGAGAVLTTQRTQQEFVEAANPLAAAAAAVSPPRAAGSTAEELVAAPPALARGASASKILTPQQQPQLQPVPEHQQLPAQADSRSGVCTTSSSSVSNSLPGQAAPQPNAVAVAPAGSWAPFEVLFLRHDGYLGALGALVKPGSDCPVHSSLCTGASQPKCQ